MTATITQSTAITEVTAAVDIFMNYVNQGDLENMLAMYSEDSSVLPPQGNSLYGIAAVSAFWQNMLQNVGFGNVQYTIEELEQLAEDTVVEMTS